MIALLLAAIALAPGLYIAREMQWDARIGAARRRGEELRRAVEIAQQEDQAIAHAHYERGFEAGVSYLEETKTQYYRDGFREGRRTAREETLADLDAVMKSFINRGGAA